jgi:hypothetical protein
MAYLKPRHLLLPTGQLIQQSRGGILRSKRRPEQWGGFLERLLSETITKEDQVRVPSEARLDFTLQQDLDTTGQS